MRVREPVLDGNSALFEHDLAELDLPEDIGVVDRLELQSTDHSDRKTGRDQDGAATWILGSLRRGFGRAVRLSLVQKRNNGKIAVVAQLDRRVVSLN